MGRRNKGIFDLCFGRGWPLLSLGNVDRDTALEKICFNCVLSSSDEEEATEVALGVADFAAGDLGRVGCVMFALSTVASSKLPWTMGERALAEAPPR